MGEAASQPRPLASDCMEGRGRLPLLGCRQSLGGWEGLAKRQLLPPGVPWA